MGWGGDAWRRAEETAGEEVCEEARTDGWGTGLGGWEGGGACRHRGPFCVMCDGSIVPRTTRRYFIAERPRCYTCTRCTRRAPRIAKNRISERPLNKIGLERVQLSRFPLHIHSLGSRSRVAKCRRVSHVQGPLPLQPGLPPWSAPRRPRWPGVFHRPRRGRSRPSSRHSHCSRGTTGRGHHRRPQRHDQRHAGADPLRLDPLRPRASRRLGARIPAGAGAAHEHHRDVLHGTRATHALLHPHTPTLRAASTILQLSLPWCFIPTHVGRT